MKLILGYIQFRLGLDGYEWTFSQSEIATQLGLPQKMTNRRCQQLIRNGIFVTGAPVKCDTGEYIPMTIRKGKLTEFIKGGSDKVTTGQVKVTIGSDKVTEGVSQGDCYNKNNTNKDNKEEYTNKGKLEPVAVSPETEAVLVKLKEKKLSESPEAKLKEEQDFQELRVKLFAQCKLEEIKRVNISAYQPSDQTIWELVNKKLKLGYAKRK